MHIQKYLFLIYSRDNSYSSKEYDMHILCTYISQLTEAIISYLEGIDILIFKMNVFKYKNLIFLYIVSCTTSYYYLTREV